MLWYTLCKVRLAARHSHIQTPSLPAYPVAERRPTRPTCIGTLFDPRPHTLHATATATRRTSQFDSQSACSATYSSPANTTRATDFLLGLNTYTPSTQTLLFFSMDRTHDPPPQACRSCSRPWGGVTHPTNLSRPHGAPTMCPHRAIISRAGGQAFEHGEPSSHKLHTALGCMLWVCEVFGARTVRAGIPTAQTQETQEDSTRSGTAVHGRAGGTAASSSQAHPRPHNLHIAAAAATDKQQRTLVIGANDMLHTSPNS